MIHNMSQYIADKIEEFRIAGKKPAYLGLSEVAHKQLSDELRPKERVPIGDKEVNDKALVSEFLGLNVITVHETPIDGVYIHEI
jgi:hypothetical protein